MRLEETDSELNGNHDHCWAEYVDNRNRLSCAYNLSADQKNQYLYNLLCKNALCFYSDHVEPYAIAYQQSVNMIDCEFYSPVQKVFVMNHFTSLRVISIVSDSVEISLNLAKVYKIILVLSGHCLPLHIGDIHCIRWFRQYIVDY